MGFKIKNSLTGEFEKLPILTLKGEKGETGGVEEYNKVDYMGNKYETLKQANDANVEYAVKTAIGEFNYLDYDGQNITALDTIAGQAKNAVLKGQTLVNVINYNNTMISTSSKYVQFSSMIKEIIAKTITIVNDSNKSVRIQTEVNGTYNRQISINANSKKAVVLNADEKLTRIRGSQTDGWSIDETGLDELKRTVMIIEGDHSNIDIPYFEGMKSVQMPVLTTTGKNLMPVNHARLDEIDANTGGHKQNLIAKNIPVIPGKTYTASYSLSYSTNVQGINITRYEHQEKTNSKNHSELWNEIGKDDSKLTFTIPQGINYISFTFGNAVYTNDGKPGWIQFDNIQLEEGSTATPYESHKSNILTCNEEVELRKVGDVQDELNLLTGELTQRVGEVVLDGNAGWSEYNGNYYVSAPGVQAAEKLPWGKATILSNLYPSFIGEETDVYIVSGWNGNQIKIRDVNLSLEELKSKLMTQPLVATYISNEESVKTVDLSDNVVYSYDEVTHYDCSSEEGSLVPTLSVKVPTDVQATIAQQRETIQTLNSENERLNQIQEALKASMLDSQVQLMNLSWDTDFEVFTLRESIAPKGFSMDSKTGSNIDKFSQAKFIIENDCPDLEKLNSQIEYYFSKDVFSQEQFEELTDLISIVKGGNGCEY